MDDQKLLKILNVAKEYTSGSVELEDPILEIEKPRFAVFFNDDYTPMEFVVYVIQQFFGFDHAKATEVMLQIHKRKGLLWRIFKGNC